MRGIDSEMNWWRVGFTPGVPPFLPALAVELAQGRSEHAR